MMIISGTGRLAEALLLGAGVAGGTALAIAVAENFGVRLSLITTGLVTLATAIPEDVCRAANLGYLDPASVDVAAFAADPDTLVVPRAGEMLFRLR